MLSFKFVKALDLNNDIITLKLNNECLTKKQIDWKKDESDFGSWYGCLTDVELKPGFMADVKAQSHIKIEICLEKTGFSNELLLHRKSGGTLFEYKSNIEIKDLALGSEMMVNHLKNVLDLSDLEQENSKWCLLTAVELMASIDFEKYRAEIFAYLEKLASEIDVFRRNFYLDLKKKILANNVT